MAGGWGVLLLLFFFLVVVSPQIEAHQSRGAFSHGRFVKKDSRKILSSSDCGQVSAVEVRDAYGRNYQLHFFSLEPRSVFLPVLLHSDMVVYVQTGRGNLGWIDESKMNRISMEQGDVFRLPSGSVFYAQSEPSQTREKLRLHAIFTNKKDDDITESFTGTYSSITDLVLGFDRKILQTAFRVSDEVMEAIAKAERPPAIVHMEKTDSESDDLDWASRLIESLGMSWPFALGGHHVHKDNKHKPFNILKKKPDFSNFYGWSLAVDHKEFDALKGSNIGLFMVNLTKGSMMGPHWNPRATEIGIVTYGEGMVEIVSPNQTDRYKCRRFKVEPGDVFVASRFEPMSQISYDNDSLVFMGFSTMSKKNHPQFLAGISSVLQTLGEEIVSLSFNANRSYVRHFLSSQADAIILACPYCAVEEEKLMREEEWERKREEEEQTRKREEEEQERREREEEEARKKSEEEERRERDEKEARKKSEEEERREREKEEEKRREEEEERREREEEEEIREREEEQARRREEEEGGEEEGRWRKVLKGRRKGWY